MEGGGMGSPPMLLKSLFVLAGAAVLSLHGTATATSPGISATLLSQQQTVNAQIELYYVQQGRLPWSPGEVAGTQWRPLVEMPRGQNRQARLESAGWEVV